MIHDKAEKVANNFVEIIRHRPEQLRGYEGLPQSLWDVSGPFVADNQRIPHAGRPIMQDVVSHTVDRSELTERILCPISLRSG